MSDLLRVLIWPCRWFQPSMGLLCFMLTMLCLHSKHVKNYFEFSTDFSLDKCLHMLTMGIGG